MSLEIVFVLVGTTHSGNIGAAARAMKTMGFHSLRLVDTCSHQSYDAIARASGASDVLDGATFFDTLGDAIADCHVVIGTSARARQLSVPLQSPREICDELAERKASSAPGQRVAMVFGQERSGLSNESLDVCTRLLRIPCNPDFSSLNLGSAVQVVSYELSQALASLPLGPPVPGPGKWKAVDSGDEPAPSAEHAQLPASSEDMQRFFDHLERVMIATGFLNPDNPRQLRRRVRRYFERNRPENSEISILRGILSAVETTRGRPDSASDQQPPGMEDDPC